VVPDATARTNLQHESGGYTPSPPFRGEGEKRRARGFRERIRQRNIDRSDNLPAMPPAAPISWKSWALYNKHPMLFGEVP